MAESTKPKRRRQRITVGSPKEKTLKVALGRKAAFLDTWFSLHSLTYNKFFDLTGGNGAEMIETLMIERPRMFHNLMVRVRAV